MQTMYPAIVNSPETELSAAINAVQTTISLLDASKVPAAPNIAVIGKDETAETIMYTGKSGNDLTGVTRGFQGTAKAWSLGAKAARYFTAYDYEAERQNIVEINGTTPKVTTADITMYVSSTGNNSNDGLTTGTALLTVTEALSRIPQVVNHIVTVSVAAGTYAEVISIAGFIGRGSIAVTGGSDQTVAANYIVNSIGVLNTALVINVNGFTASTTAGTAFDVTFSAKNTSFNNCRTVVAAFGYAGFNAWSSPHVYWNNCLVSNRTVGMRAQVNASVIIINGSGTGNTLGVVSDSAIVRTNGVVPIGTTLFATSAGGEINNLSSGVLNSWGDNTLAARSYVYATMGAVAPVASGVWTKLPFSVETADNLAEFDTALNRFTAKHTGLYLVAYAVRFDAIAAGFECVLGIYVNAGRAWSRSSFSVAPGTTMDMQMIREVRLNVGDYIESYAYQNTGATKNVVNSADVTNLVICQIA